MEYDSRLPNFMKNDLFVTMCGLIVGLGSIFQSWLYRPQWQKDWLLFLGALVLTLDIMVLSIMVYKKNNMIRNIHKEQTSSEIQ